MRDCYLKLASEWGICADRVASVCDKFGVNSPSLSGDQRMEAAYQAAKALFASKGDLANGVRHEKG